MKGTKKYKLSQRVVEVKSCTATLVILDIETHFAYIRIVTLYWLLKRYHCHDSPLMLAPRLQPRYSTIRYCFILLVSYVMLRSGKSLSLLKKMHFVLSSTKWIDTLLSTNQSHTFVNSLFKTFSITVTSLCWQKIIVSSACRYVWVFDKACEISCIYSKKNNSPNIDPWRTPQFMVAASKKTLPNETKKVLFVRYEWNHFIFHLKNVCSPFCLIKFFNLRCLKPFENQLKFYQDVFHFQHCLKSCQLIETNMYWWNDLL